MKHNLLYRLFFLFCVGLGLNSCSEDQPKQTFQLQERTDVSDNKSEEKVSRDFVRFPSNEVKPNTNQPETAFVTRLDELFAAYIPKDEVFTINPLDESFLTTENGTQLYFQSESFLSAAGKVVTDSVAISVKVFDDYMDYAAGNLVTQTTKDQFLQTGGMFHLAAEANGEEVFLDPNLPAQISIPLKGEYESAMHSYYGVEHEGMVKWVDTKDAFPMYSNSKKVEFGKPEKKFHLSIKADGKESGKVIESFISKETEENWLDWMEKQNLSGTELENYLSTSNHWLNLDLKFAEDGSMVYLFNEREVPQNVVSQLAKVLEKAPEILYESTEGAQFTDRFHLLVTGTYDKAENTHNKRSVKKYGSHKFEKVDTLSEDLLKNYVLEVRSMGYLNCDAFPDGVKPQKARIKVPGEIKNPRVWVLFTGIAGIVRGILKGNDIEFIEVPVGMSAKIVAIGERDGIPVMSETFSVFEKNQTISSEFTRFSYNQLEKVFK